MPSPAPAPSIRALDPKLKPTTVEHMKIHTEDLAVFTDEGHLRQRSRQFVIREILAEAAAKLRLKHAKELGPVKRSAAGAGSSKKAGR